MEQQIFQQVVEILRPYVKSPSMLAQASMSSSLLGDLQVNSARMVDVVLEMEDKFGIQVSDEAAGSVNTVGDAVQLVMSLKSA